MWFEVNAVLHCEKSEVNGNSVSENKNDPSKIYGRRNMLKRILTQTSVISCISQATISIEMRVEIFLNHSPMVL